VSLPLIQIRRSPVSALVSLGTARVRVRAHLVGRLSRTGGAPTLAEVEVDGTDRVTLVPASDVEPLTPEARQQMLDVGHP